MKRRTNYNQSDPYDPSQERADCDTSPNYLADNQRNRYSRKGSDDNRNSNFLYLVIISAFIVYGMYTLNQKYGSGIEGNQAVWGNSERTSALRGEVNTPENNSGIYRNDNTPVPEAYDTRYSARNIEPPEENPDVGNRSFSPAQNATTALPSEVLVVETPPAPRVFYVQAGAFQSLENAQKQQDKLIEQGYKVLIVQFESDELGLHRILLGEFNKEENANARAQKLKSGRVFELVNGRYYEL